MTLIWLVALGLFNSVVSAFYYVRVLKAMFLREPGPKRLAAGRPADRHPDRRRHRGGRCSLGCCPMWPMAMMQAAAVPMLTTPATVPPIDPAVLTQKTARRPHDPAAECGTARWRWRRPS